MQAFPVTILAARYDGPMQTGRPSTEPRTEFGQRLHVAREALGLSQAQVAAQLGITQKAYAVWERYPVALRPDQIEKVAAILKVSVESLFGKAAPALRGNGPAGKLRQVFDRASQLPRHQQNKVAEFVEAFVAQHLDSQGKAA
jgi:transcriptional regulator with XRE-family HTH domain